MSAANAFRSARLIYKAIDGADDDDFLLLQSSEYQSQAQQDPTLLQPASKKNVEEAKKMLEKCLLAVLICLPPPSSSSSSSSSSPDAKNPTSSTASQPEEPSADGAAAAAAAAAAGDKKTDQKTPPDGEKPKPTPIGHIILMANPSNFSHHRRSEIGIGLLEAHHGRGYGSEAIEWVLEYGFQRAGLHRIGIGAFAWNTRAWALYERLGFVIEGRQRDFWWHEGEWHDCILMGMLEGEWRERHKEKLRLKKREGMESAAAVFGVQK